MAKTRDKIWRVSEGAGTMSSMSEDESEKEAVSSSEESYTETRSGMEESESAGEVDVDRSGKENADKAGDDGAVEEVAGVEGREYDDMECGSLETGDTAFILLCTDVKKGREYGLAHLNVP